MIDCDKNFWRFPLAVKIEGSCLILKYFFKNLHIELINIVVNGNTLLIIGNVANYRKRC